MSQKYIVQCIKACPKDSVFSMFRPGKYVSYTVDKDAIKATTNINRAHVESGDWFGMGDGYTWGCVGDYFRRIPVKVKVKVSPVKRQKFLDRRG